MPYPDGYLAELTWNIDWFTKLSTAQSSSRNADIIINRDIRNQTSGDRIHNPDF
jgi:hypothetical protein